MRMIVFLCGVVFLLESTFSDAAFSQSRDFTNPVAILRIPPNQIGDAEFDRIVPNEAQILRLADFYNFKQGTQTFVISQMLRCPLWTKRLVVEYSSIEANRVSSVFLALIPSRGGNVDLIPISFHGLGTLNYDPAFDPHNIAIFNKTIDEESLSLNNDGDWVQLAVCYLGIVIKSPKLLLPANIAELIQPTSNEVVQRLSPKVKVMEGDFEVLLYEVIGDDRDVVEWTLDFDRKGFLRNIHSERKRRSAVLNPGGRN